MKYRYEIVDALSYNGSARIEQLKKLGYEIYYISGNTFFLRIEIMED